MKLAGAPRGRVGESGAALMFLQRLRYFILHQSFFSEAKTFFCRWLVSLWCCILFPSLIIQAGLIHPFLEKMHVILEFIGNLIGFETQN